MTPYDRLKELGLKLPSPATPMANYVPFVMVNGLLYLSGQGPRRADGSLCTGKVGSEVSVEDAYQHAQLTGLNLLADMEAHAASSEAATAAIRVRFMESSSSGGCTGNACTLVNTGNRGFIPLNRKKVLATRANWANDRVRNGQPRESAD